MAPLIFGAVEDAPTQRRLRRRETQANYVWGDRAKLGGNAVEVVAPPDAHRHDQIAFADLMENARRSDDEGLPPRQVLIIAACDDAAHRRAQEAADPFRVVEGGTWDALDEQAGGRRLPDAERAIDEDDQLTPP